MKYDFDTVVERRGTGSYKWDSASHRDVLPLWVADMDFVTAPVIVEALRRRVEHGIFGYTKVPDLYYDTAINWFTRRHGWAMKREWLTYTTGVVPALSAIIRAMSAVGDKVLVQPPVYNCFCSSIENVGCRVVNSDLKYENGSYTVDLEDLERKCSDPSVKLMILCNPHNPTGRVWSRTELTAIGEICARNTVFVIADEIHCDLVYPEHKYTPFASISEEFLQNSATCTSPSKAFNLAGLQIANITIADEEVRRKVDKAINIHEVCDVNPFGVAGLIAAYGQGEEWLDELVRYIESNYVVVREFFEANMAHIALIEPQGTYLLWADCSALGKPSAQITKELLDHHKVWLNEGSIYGDNGRNFIRINIACPRSVLNEALTRMAAYFNY